LIPAEDSRANLKPWGLEVGAGEALKPLLEKDISSSNSCLVVNFLILKANEKLGYLREMV
jgi:hypothetical protein